MFFQTLETVRESVPVAQRAEKAKALFRQHTGVVCDEVKTEQVKAENGIVTFIVGCDNAEHQHYQDQ